MSRLRALSLAAGLVGWSLVSPRLPAPWRIPLQAGLGSVLVLVTRATMGLWPPRLWAGLRLAEPGGRRAAPVLARGPMVWRPATTGRSAAATAAKVAMAPTHRSPAVMAVTAVPVATAGWSVTVGPAVMAVTEPRVPAMPI